MTPEEEQEWYRIYLQRMTVESPRGMSIADYTAKQGYTPKTFAEFKTDVLEHLGLERRTPFRRYRFDKSFHDNETDWLKTMLSLMNAKYRYGASGFADYYQRKGEVNIFHPSRLNP